MAITLCMRGRRVCIALLLSACGPSVTIGEDSGSSSEPEPTTQSSPITTTVTTTTTTSSTTGTNATDGDPTSTGEDECEQLGTCGACHDGFRIDFYALDALGAQSLLPTSEGGFVAIGTPESPGSIAWLDARGEVTASAGPYAEGLSLKSATWGPNERLILAGRIEQQFWVGVTDSTGTLLMDSTDDEYLNTASHYALADIQVEQHDIRGIFVTAHVGGEPQATSLVMLQFNHDVIWRRSVSVLTEPFELSPTRRGASTLTSTETLVAVTKGAAGLRLLHRETPVPWNIAESQVFDVDLPGLPASIAALHGNSVVTASNDETAHLARVDDGEDLIWHRALAGLRAERVGFDAVHDLVFVAGSDRDAEDALSIAALDLDGNDVWAWTALPTPEGPSTPVLDVVALPDGGVAVSTSGSLWYATVRPYAC